MRRAEHVSRRLKLRQLETLMAVSQCGSMAKAAEQLAVTQPVVSKAIADLETTLGVRLLDRSAKGAEPTVYGRALLERSVMLFNDLRTSVTELEFLSDPTAGELRVGSSHAIASGMLGVIIDRLSREHPRLTFEVTLDPTDLPYRDLRAHAIDLIIGRMPEALPDDLQAVALYDDISFVVASTENPLTQRRRVALHELTDQPWCGPSFEARPWSLIGDAFVAAGLPVPRNVVRMRSILARYGLLATGRFLTVLPRTVLHFSGKSLALRRVPVDMPDQSYPVGIMTLKHRMMNPVADRFVACARDVAKPFLRGR